MPLNAPYILYLDYDGVLHPDEVTRHVKYPHIRLNAPDHSLFEHVPLLDELLDPFPLLRIVLSTSWVAAFDYYRARSKLSFALQQRVVGATYHTLAYDRSDFFNMTRFQQISADLSRRAPLQWLALDNDDTLWPDSARKFLVKTPDYEGLGDIAAQTDLTSKLKRMFEPVSV